MWFKSLRVLRLLSIKSIKLTYRKSSNQILILISSIAVYGSLYLMWYLSLNQELKFLTSSAYYSLAFDMKCNPVIIYNSNQSYQHISCHSYGKNIDPASKGLSPSDLLFNQINDNKLLTNEEDISEFIGLISSIMMNGLPLIGMNDYIAVSDLINKNIDKNMKQMILHTPGYKEKFSNILNIRSKYIIFASNSCWILQFIEYLKTYTNVLKNMKYKVYSSMEKAIHHSHHHIWAIIDITSLQQDEIKEEDCRIFNYTSSITSSTSSSSNFNSKSSMNINNMIHETIILKSSDP